MAYKQSMKIIYHILYYMQVLGDADFDTFVFQNETLYADR